MTLDDIKPGDTLVADGGFACLTEGQLCPVHQDPSRPGAAGLFVHCLGPIGHDDKPECPDQPQRHYLDGQENEDGEVVGLTRPCEAVAHG